jgi:ABC-type lipoprotein export system ATPase subunit
MAPKPLVVLDHVSHSFDDGRIVALKDVNLTIVEGESVAIVGASGSGKTTLILVMCGIRIPTKGILRWKGEPVTTLRQWTDLRRSEIGIVFQDFNLFPTLTASENVEVAMFGSSASTSERRRRVEEALETVDLADRATTCPRSCPEGSVSEWPSREASSTIRCSFSPTSLPAISTVPMPPRFWTSYFICSARAV